MNTVAGKIIEFNETLVYSGSLPNGIAIMNPFRTRQLNKKSGFNGFRSQLFCYSRGDVSWVCRKRIEL